MSACGVDPDKPRLTLYLEKTGQLSPIDLSKNRSIEAGNIMEEPIAKLFKKRFGFEVWEDDKLYRHNAYPWIAGHIDRFVKTDEGIKTFLECKNTNWLRAADWQGEDIPRRVIYQVHQYMAILNVPFCYVGVCIGGEDFRYKKIDAQKVIIDFIIEKEREFWHMVRNRIEPPLDQILEENPQLARRLFPHETGDNDLDLSPIREDVIRHREIAVQLKALTKEYNERRDRIRAFMKANPKGHVENHRVYYRSRDVWGFDESAMKKKYPHIYREFTRKRSDRTLIVREVKSKPEEATINLLDEDYFQLDGFTEAVFYTDFNK